MIFQKQFVRRALMRQEDYLALAGNNPIFSSFINLNKILQRFCNNNAMMISSSVQLRRFIKFSFP